MSYSNVDNWQVILINGVRDPDLSFHEHRDRDSLGGVDLVASIGTPIHAPDDCVISNIANNGSGGNTVNIYIGPWIDQMMHLSEFVSPGAKRKGELIGYTGDTVAPGYDSVDSHLHWHRIGPWYEDAWGRTNRYNPFHYFIANNDTEIGDNDMSIATIARREDNGKGYYLNAESIHHVADDKEWPALRYSIGAPKDTGRNEFYGKDDFRILIQANGWNYDQVAHLAPGETLLRGGVVLPRNVWPPAWA